MNSQDALLVEGFLNHIEDYYTLIDVDKQDMYTTIGEDIDTIRASIENIIDNNLGTTEEIDAVLGHCDNLYAPTTTLCNILAQTDLGIPLDVAANLETKGELFNNVTDEEKQEAVNEAFGREIDIDKYQDNTIGFVAGGFAEESDYINDRKYDFPASSSGEAIVTENGYIMDYMHYDMWEAPQELVDIVVEMHPVHTYQIHAVVDGYEKGLTADEIKIYADSGLHSSVMEAVKDAIVEAKEGYSVASDINDIKEKVEAYKEAISEIFTDENGDFDGEKYYDASFSFEDAITGDTLDEKLDAILFRAENSDRLDLIENSSKDENLDYQIDLFKATYEEFKDDKYKDTKLDIASVLVTGYTEGDIPFQEDVATLLSTVDSAMELANDKDIEITPHEAAIAVVYGISKDEVKEMLSDWKDDDDRTEKINNAGSIIEAIREDIISKDDIGDVKEFVDNHNDDMNVVGSLISETAVVCEIVKDEDLTDKIKDILNKDPDGFKHDVDMFLQTEKDAGVSDTVQDKVETIATRAEIYPKELAVQELVENDVKIGNLDASKENVIEIIDEIKEMITNEDGEIDPDKVEEFNAEYGDDWINEQITNDEDLSEYDVNDVLGSVENFDIANPDNEKEITQELDNTLDKLSDNGEENNDVTTDDKEDNVEKGEADDVEDDSYDKVDDDEE